MNTQSSYDRVAEEYARRVYGELAGKPLDRKLLDWLIEKVDGRGVIADIGCGPGQIARYLSDHGAAACGVDLSPGMLAQARTLNPDLEFTQADMRTLEGIADGAYAGISAFYSIIHVPEDELVQAFTSFKRVLQPDGVVLLAFHLGAEIKHLDEWWGEPVSVDFIFYSRETIKQKLTEAGFTVEEALERDPYPEVEFASRRGYIFARV
ncbi:MAG: class I SAM-dependent methyltransferase [Anaerolineae bacterium]|nr:class I SAM-dependent methyltransferase [Anaerolineae bacterium]